MAELNDVQRIVDPILEKTGETFAELSVRVGVSAPTLIAAYKGKWSKKTMVKLEELKDAEDERG